MEWNDLKIILAIGRTGTLSAAAKKLGVAHSTIFRRINLIESNNAIRFFERHSHGYDATEAGDQAIQTAKRMEAEMLDLNLKILGKDLTLQGNIRITAPIGISVKSLGSHLYEFCQINPNIQIDLIVTCATLSLSKFETEIALRVTNDPPKDCIGRRICDFSTTLYANQNYLDQHHNFQLQDYDYLLASDIMDWLPKSIARDKINVKFTSDNILNILEMTKRGLGVAPLPCFLGDHEKDLVRLIDPPKELNQGLWLLFHSDLRKTARIKQLFDFIFNALAQQKELFSGR